MTNGSTRILGLDPGLRRTGWGVLVAEGSRLRWVAHGVVTPPEAAPFSERLLHLFEALNKLGTTVVVATHDFHLLGRIPGAQMMRLDRGRLLDPTGSLRYPPTRPE